MNFFEHQDLARKKTARLVVLFTIAVVAIIAALYAVSVIAVSFVQLRNPDPGEFSFQLWNPVALALALGGGLLLIGGGSAYKFQQLRRGGMAVADALGGKILVHENADADGERLLNIVEEMAIASGVPVPPVYLLPHEEGINAFAAGYAPEDAVIGVTHGALHGLSRDQLQGVIAHEFSHILSGDMRLNLKLVAVLHGILILGLTGVTLMRAMYYSGAAYRPRSSRDNNGGGAVIAMFVIAGSLAAIGYIGTFFGNLIKNAVSRQREYLADASAVQFTRNPEGIGGALRVLGGARRKGRLRSPNAPEMSHMFFGDAMARSMGSAMSTHPPLSDRIRRIQPDWDGEYAAPRDIPPVGPVGGRSPVRHSRYRVASFAAEGTDPTRMPATITIGIEGGPPRTGQGFAIEPRHAVARAGAIEAESVARAQALLTAIPEQLRTAAHDPHDARAIILAMLIPKAKDDPARGRQALALRNTDIGLGRAVARLAPAVIQLDDELRLPLLELAMQPMTQLSAEQVIAFTGLLDAFINADDTVTVFEWIVRRLVDRKLKAAAGAPVRQRVRFYALAQLTDECSVLLSAVARSGVASAGQNRNDAIRAFATGAAELRELELEYREGKASGLRALSAALDALETTSPKLKKRLLEACAATVTDDGKVTAREAELFRAIAESLSVPMPLMYATA